MDIFLSFLLGMFVGIHIVDFVTNLLEKILRRIGYETQ
jgi:hypothetical protein